MWVLFDHTCNFGPADLAIPVVTKSGLMAVICFFVISGFSIRQSIETKPTGYLRRRFWRIFPINALAVFIGWFAWSALGLSGGYGTPPFKITTRDFVGCLLLLEAFLPIMIPFFFPAWSLSLEAPYHVCAPLLQRSPFSSVHSSAEAAYADRRAMLNGGRIIPHLMARLAALLKYLGEISYPIYLLHYPVLFVLTSSVLKTYAQFNNGAVHLVVALLAAALAYQYADKPRRTFGSQAKTAALGSES